MKKCWFVVGRRRKGKEEREREKVCCWRKEKEEREKGERRKKKERERKNAAGERRKKKERERVVGDGFDNALVKGPTVSANLRTCH